MVEGGLDRIKLSVDDLNQARDFFTDVFEINFQEEAELDPVVMLPESLRGREWGVRAAYGAIKHKATWLELVEIDAGRSRASMPARSHHDCGLYDIAFVVKDLTGRVEACRWRGFEPISEAVTYTADWLNITIQEIIIQGPANTRIALAQVVSEPVPQFEGEVATLVDVAQVVANLDEVAAFYVDALGYRQSFDRQLPEAFDGHVLGFPAGSRVRISALSLDQSYCAVELIQCSTPGRPALEVRPDRPGLLGLAYETKKLQPLLNDLKQRGCQILSGPARTSIGVHGLATVALVEGPNGVLFEFFEVVRGN